MPQNFDYFIIFAGMRTGSNFLEANINQFSGLHCHGEAFNPSFLCYPDGRKRFGFSLSRRESDPLGFIQAMRRHTPGLAGFRFFRDHDPRILRHCLNDRRCAKIILTRNPLESYVSRKIAQATGQWKLSDVRHRKEARIRFEPAEFRSYLDDEQKWQRALRRELQTTGQSGFHLDYKDVGDLAVLNGLARFLGQTAQITALSSATCKQNPAPLTDKVTNPREMIRALAGLDLFGLSDMPDFEPERGAAIPEHVAAARAPLLYMPVRMGLEIQVKDWLCAIDGVERTALKTGFSQKSLRQWKRRHPGHRSFTVVRHPLARAHAAFCNHILNTEKGSYAKIRRTLQKVYGVDLTDAVAAGGHDRPAHRRAFLQFLQFLQGNLAGQTGVRIDPAWASQSHVLQGFGGFALPDMVLRAEDLNQGLQYLAEQVGLQPPPLPPQIRETQPCSLAEIYDEEIEAAARGAYQRDYMMFGYRAWGDMGSQAA